MTHNPQPPAETPSSEDTSQADASKRRPRRRFWRAVRLSFVVLAFSVCGLLLLIRFAPQVLLQAVGFVPEGDVEIFWQNLGIFRPDTDDATAIAELVGVPLVLTQAPTEAFTPLPPASLTPTLTPTITATTNAGIVPQATSNATTQATATPLPTNTPLPTATHSATPVVSDLGDVVDPSLPPVISLAGFFGQELELDRFAMTANVPVPITLSLETGRIAADYFQIGDDLSGNSLGLVQYSEEGIDILCRSWPDFCDNSSYRIIEVDFRDRGAILYAEINASNVYWQELGIALVLNDDNITFQPVGIILDGEALSFPTSGPVARALNTLIEKGNEALRSAFIRSGPYELRLDALRLTEESLTIVLR